MRQEVRQVDHALLQIVLHPPDLLPRLLLQFPLVLIERNLLQVFMVVPFRPYRFCQLHTDRVDAQIQSKQHQRADAEPEYQFHVIRPRLPGQAEKSVIQNNARKNSQEHHAAVRRFHAVHVPSPCEAPDSQNHDQHKGI